MSLYVNVIGYLRVSLGSKQLQNLGELQSLGRIFPSQLFVLFLVPHSMIEESGDSSVLETRKRLMLLIDVAKLCM